jgi:hypothetical protein
LLAVVLPAQSCSHPPPEQLKMETQLAQEHLKCAPASSDWLCLPVVIASLVAAVSPLGRLQAETSSSSSFLMNQKAALDISGWIGTQHARA